MFDLILVTAGIIIAGIMLFMFTRKNDIQAGIFCLILLVATEGLMIQNRLDAVMEICK